MTLRSSRTETWMRRWRCTRGTSSSPSVNIKPLPAKPQPSYVKPSYHYYTQRVPTLLRCMGTWRPEYLYVQWKIGLGLFAWPENIHSGHQRKKRRKIKITSNILMKYQNLEEKKNKKILILGPFRVQNDFKQNYNIWEEKEANFCVYDKTGGLFSSTSYQLISKQFLFSREATQRGRKCVCLSWLTTPAQSWHPATVCHRSSTSSPLSGSKLSMEEPLKKLRDLSCEQDPCAYFCWTEKGNSEKLTPCTKHVPIPYSHLMNHSWEFWH